MLHTHLPIQHLLKEVEKRGQNRTLLRKLPDLLHKFIDEVADCFEPVEGVARVGYECQVTQERWLVSMFLGKAEHVGGKDDGLQQIIPFELNLQGVFSRFDRVEKFRWQPEEMGNVPDQDKGLITIIGMVGKINIELRIKQNPPQDAVAGIRILPNGEYESIN
jgi:hypothetical protein